MDFARFFSKPAITFFNEICFIVISAKINPREIVFEALFRRFSVLKIKVMLFNILI